jgi:hypothetical protein
MATQQFGYGPGVWAPAKGVGAVEIPKLLQPGAVTPDFKPENPYKALAAKAIGEMAYSHFMGGREKEEEKFSDTTPMDDWLYGQKYAEQRKKMEGRSVGATAQEHSIFTKSLAEKSPDDVDFVGDTYTGNIEDYRVLRFGNSADSSIIHNKHGVLSADGKRMYFRPNLIPGVAANKDKGLTIHKIGNDWYILK